MRISILNLSLMVEDAVGTSIVNQMRFFVRRGDEVRLYVMAQTGELPADIAPLTRMATLGEMLLHSDEHFARSDLYIYHYPGRYPLLETMRGIERGFVILFYHNVTPAELWGRELTADWLRHSTASVESLAAYADLIVTPSEFNANELINDHHIDRARVRVLPLAVPLDKFGPGPKDPALVEQYGLEGKRVILFVGRMAGNKRVDVLVAALPLVKRAVPNATLLLVGDKSANQAFKDNVADLMVQARALGCEADVLLTGVVPDVASHFRLAEVYASASLHEGFGVPLIEAMASGVPVVVANAAAHPLVVGDAGLLAEAGSVDDMAAKLIDVLTQDELYGQLVRKGLQRAKEFSLEKHDENWAKIVREATEYLPPQLVARARSLPARMAKGAMVAPTLSLSTAPTSPPNQAVAHPAVLLQSAVSAELARLESMSDIMIRGYVVRSRLPLVGGLLAWLRRNLTSHLREPYLDPMIERQVAFNRDVLKLLRRVVEESAYASATGASARSAGSNGNYAQQIEGDEETRLRFARIETLLAGMAKQVEQIADTVSPQNTPVAPSASQSDSAETHSMKMQP